MTRCKDVEDKLIGKIRPSKPDLVLFLYDEESAYTQRASGIWIPGGQEAKHRWDRVGTVIGVGSKIQGLKPGDRCLIRKGYGLEVPHENMGSSKLVRISQDQLEAVLTGKAEQEDYDLERDGL